MRKWQEIGLAAIILIVAAALRFTGIAWDDYHHYHPDERFIAWAATTIEWPADRRTAFSPHLSSFNPFYWPPDAASEGIEVLRDRPRNFAYGHFPLYLGVAATRLAEAVGPWLAARLPAEWLLTRDILNARGMVEFRHLTAVSRALTALFDVGTVLLVYLLGRRLYGTAVGLLAAAFLAVNVMHIQLAHFFTFDPHMTFFVAAAALCLVVVVQGSGALRAQGAGEQGSGALRAQGAEERRSRGAEGNGLRNTEHGTRITDYRLPITVYWFLAAVCVGLAVGSKFAAVLLLLPLALTAWQVWPQRWLWWGGTAVVVAFLSFAVTNPFALLDLTCEATTPAIALGPLQIPALNWGSCFLANLSTQSAMVRGDLLLPFTQQYSGTLPYLYFIEMQLRWGMGPLLGAAAFAGFGWVVWRTAADVLASRGAALFERRERRSSSAGAEEQRGTDDGLRVTGPQSPTPDPRSLIVVLAWCVPFFVTTGGFQVKFMRYLQPLTPFLMIFAAALLLALPWRRVRWVGITAVLLTTILYALSFVNIYNQPHPWVAASEWVFRHVQPGTLLLSERWDDSLPSSMVVDGRMRRRAEYPNGELTWLSGSGARDNEAKLEANLALLAEAGYVTILSNRAYGVLPRLPQTYPLSSQYHQLLFSGALGYEPVFVAGRAPQLGGVQLHADTFAGTGLAPPALVADFLAQQPRLLWGRADESFLVYDQPLTIIFENTGRLSAAEMRALFEAPGR